MKKCLIIGGGISGLTAASYLVSKKIKVTLLESSPKLGGRAYSFFDQETQTILDNGQHIMMGCFNETLDLLNLIEAKDNFIFQKNLKIEFLHEEFGNINLNADKWFYPFNLLSALLKFKIFDNRDKLQLIKFLLSLPFQSKKKLNNITVKQWLIESEQTENLIKYFWEIIGIGALNSSISKASALLFYEIITQILYRGNFASTIILQKNGLSKSLIDPLNSFIVKNNGDIILSNKVNRLVIEKDNVVSVLTGDEKLSDYDYLISAIPLYSLARIIDLNILNINIQFEYSSILNIHLWIEGLNLKEKFYGFLDSPLHWIFVKEEHFNIVISDADYLIEKDQNEIMELVINELKRFFPVAADAVKKYKIIKEKKATFIPANKVNKLRPEAETKIKNLFLAGDWTNTGLPATIESAVKSGRIAAEKVLKNI